MTVGNYNLSHIWLQFGKYQQQLRTLVVVLLALYLIAYAAELVWRLLPAPQLEPIRHDNADAMGVVITADNQSVNLSTLKRLNLFGDLTAAPVEEAKPVTDAPETRLNLTLTGVVASSDPKAGTAIIENKGSQETYGVEEKIVGTNARLIEVHPDRVIIKNGARNETLMLDGIDFKKSDTSSRPVVAATPRDERRSVRPGPQRTVLSEDAAEATREIQQRPTEFSDYIAISPHRQDGQLMGYRISPGKNPKLFKAAGFEAGDVVVEINGLDLSDPQQSLEAMNAMRQAQSVQLVVNRGDETLTLYLDFPSAGLEL